MKRSLILSAAIALTALVAGAKDYVVTDFGVSASDSTRVQTRELQAVIDRAEADGGGNIVLPRGTFLSGALFFKPGTTLTLNEGACLKGSDDVADFPAVPSRMEGRSIFYHPALVNAYFVDNFAINGPGTIDGNGMKYWVEFWDNVERARKADRPWTNLEVRRPRLVFIWGCDGVKLSGVHLINSPFWTTHFYKSRHILMENCEVQAPREPVRAPSSDAIDLDACEDVVIRGCYLNCDDDGVCLKGGKGVFATRSVENGPVKNVLVENCTFGPNLHGVVTLGSECIYASGVTLRNCRLEADCSLLRLKMRPDTWQVYENILIENVTGTCGNMIEMLPWKQFFTLEGTDARPRGVVKNVVMRNIDVECESLGVLAGNPDDTVIDWTMTDISVKAPTDIFYCNYPQSLTMERVTVNGHAPVITSANDSDRERLNHDAGVLDKNNER